MYSMGAEGGGSCGIVAGLILFVGVECFGGRERVACVMDGTGGLLLGQNDEGKSVSNCIGHVWRKFSELSYWPMPLLAPPKEIMRMEGRIGGVEVVRGQHSQLADKWSMHRSQ